jgi:hypothetical protein
MISVALGRNEQIRIARTLTWKLSQDERRAARLRSPARKTRLRPGASAAENQVEVAP